MPTRTELLAWLQQIAPLELAEEWDNVGLLLGHADGSAERILTCLTLTPDVAQEAIRERVDLIVSHHPILFHPVQSITTATDEGKLLLDLVAAGIAVYSPHTAYDSAEQGINAQLAELCQLREIVPIRPVSEERQMAHPHLQGLGSGRMGHLEQPTTLQEMIARVQQFLPTAAGIQFVGDPQHEIRTVAIACGSAAEFLRDAHREGADLLITGEARFHSCLEARTLGIALLVVGHYASERPGVERLAGWIAAQFPAVEAFASRAEADPLRLA